MDVAYPGRRKDVLHALELLAADIPELDETGNDTSWPNLTAAVHWLVDDTWWDLHDPAGSIGTILHDDAEAGAIRAVVAAVVTVSERQGPAAADARWYGDRSWPEVRRLAAAALACLTR